MQAQESKNPELVLEGTWMSSKETSQVYRNKKGKQTSHTKKGRFGSDQVFKFLPFPEAFWRTSIPLTLGEHHFGNFDFNFSKDGVGVSLSGNAPEKTTIKINQSLKALLESSSDSKEWVSADIKDSLADVFKMLKLDTAKVAVKECRIEGADAEISGHLSWGSISAGAKATGQFGALVLTLDTPIGEVDLKLKRGVGIGANIGLARTKKGKVGTTREVNFGYGNWELTLRPPEEAAKSVDSSASAKGSDVKLIPEMQAKAAQLFEKTKAKKTSQFAGATAESVGDRVDPPLVDSPDDLLLQELGELLNPPDEGSSASTAKFSSHFIRDRSFNADQLIEAGFKTSIFLYEYARLTKNKSLGQAAVGLSGLTQVFSGIKDFPKIAEVSGVLATFSAVMGPAGLILGGFSLLTSIFSGDSAEEDKTAAILYDAIMRSAHQLSKQMQEGFSGVFRGLEITERHNQERFEFTLEAIKWTYDALSQQMKKGNEELSLEIRDLRQHLDSHLLALADHPLHKTFSDIRIAESPQVLAVSGWISEIKTWLCQTSLTSARTGRVELQNGKLAIGFSDLVTRLESELSGADVSLGFYASLVEEITGETQSADLMKPGEWLKVLRVYQVLVSLYSKMVTSPDVYDALINDVDALNKISIGVRGFLMRLADSRSFWIKLVTNYQSHFDALIHKIEKEQPAISEGFTFPYTWSLVLDAEQNIKSFESKSLKEQKTDHPALTWVGLTAKRDRAKIRPINAKYDHTPPGDQDLGLRVSQGQYDSLFTRKEVRDLVTSQSMIRNQALLAYGYIKPGAVYELVTMGSNLHWDFSLYIGLGFEFKGEVYPFLQGSLFRHAGLVKTKLDDCERGWGGQIAEFVHTYAKTVSASFIEHYKGRGERNCEKKCKGPGPLVRKTREVTGTFGSHQFKFFGRDDFDNQVPQIIRAFESEVLVPLRKAIGVDRIGAGVGSHNDYLAELNYRYLSILAFVKLLDPAFDLATKFSTRNAIHREIVGIISRLVQDGDASTLQELYSKVQGKTRTFASGSLKSQMWQDDFWEYVEVQGTELVNLEVEALREQVAACLDDSHYLVSSFLEAEQGLKNVLDDLDLGKKAKYAETKMAAAEVLLTRYLSDLGQEVNNVGQILNMLSFLSEDTENVDLWLERFAKIRQQTMSSTDHEIDPVGSAEEVLADYGKMNDLQQREIETIGNDLQKLCLHETIDSIRKQLQQLEKSGAQVLDYSLHPEKGLSPLQIAIQLGRVDVVHLLLQYGGKPDLDWSSISLSESKRYQVKALFEFYKYMQDQWQEKEPLKVGKIFRLLKDNIQEVLTAIIENIENAVFFLGETGVGKSSIINALLGLIYEKVQDPEIGEPFLQMVNQTLSEVTRTSNEFRSETSFPIPIRSGNLTLIDMPGFKDSRGPEYDMAAGLLTELLYQSVASIKAVVMVCTPGDFSKQGRGKIVKQFEILGQLLKQRLDAMSNVILLVNKASHYSPKNAKVSIEKILSQPGQSLSQNAVFAMQHLNQSQIIVVDVPNATFVSNFRSYLYGMTSLQSARFDFSDFNPETQKLNKLLKRFVTYHQKNLDCYRQMMFFAFKDYSQQLNKVGFLESVDLGEIEMLSVHAELVDKRAQLLEKIKTYNELRDELFQLADSIKATLDSLDIDTQCELAFNSNRLMELHELTKVSEDFFDRIGAITDIREVQAVGIAADGTQEEAISSWPLPGAFASQRSSNLLSSGVSKLEFIGIGLMHSLFAALPKLPDGFNRGYLRDRMVLSEYAGVVEEPCVYHWPHLAWLLPQTTIVASPQNGMADLPLRMCQPAEHRLEFKLATDSNIRLEMPASTEMTLSMELGAQDARFIEQTGELAVNSFALNTVSAFVERGLTQSMKPNPFEAELAAQFAHCVLLYSLYGAPSMFMHLGLLLLEKSGCVNQSVARPLGMTLSVLLTVVLQGQSDATYLGMALQLLSGMLSAKAGRASGQLLADGVQQVIGAFFSKDSGGFVEETYVNQIT